MSNKKSKPRIISPTDLAHKVTDTDAVLSTSNIKVMETLPEIEVKDETTAVEVTKEAPKTIKLAESKSVISATTSKIASNTKLVPQSVVFIRNYIDAYLDYVNGTNPKNVKESITRFARIVTYIFSIREFITKVNFFVT